MMPVIITDEKKLINLALALDHYISIMDSDGNNFSEEGNTEIAIRFNVNRESLNRYYLVYFDYCLHS